MMQRIFFSTLHPATVVAFVLLHSSRFKFHCYAQHEAAPTQKSAWNWCCSLSWLLVQKITKGTHSCKPSSLNHPVDQPSQMRDSVSLTLTDQPSQWEIQLVLQFSPHTPLFYRGIENWKPTVGLRTVQWCLSPSKWWGLLICISNSVFVLWIKQTGICNVCNGKVWQKCAAIQE